MRAKDMLLFSSQSLFNTRVRTWLILSAMAIGITAVVLLVTLGESARSYVTNAFSNLGSHLLIVTPGRVETSGSQPLMIGGTPRDLTLEDALALYKSSSIRRVAPLSLGAAPASHQQRQREVTVLGSTAELLPVRNLKLARGRFLPSGDPDRGVPVAVIGGKLKQELFGGRRALGNWVRIHDRRFRVIGILEPIGQSLGLDVGEIAVIPVASAQSLFDTRSLFRILVQANGRAAIPKAEQSIIDILQERHEGELDVTVTSQNALLATFDGIFVALTYGVAAVAAVSLAVAGALIMNVMLISVSQRSKEIGLMKAIGCPRSLILKLFLIEAGILSLAGAGIGITVAYIGVWIVNQVSKEFPLQVPLWSLGAAGAVALATGLIFGVMPARKAARLDPVQSLNRA